MSLFFTYFRLYNKKNSKVYKYCTKVTKFLSNQMYSVFLALRAFRWKHQPGDEADGLLLWSQVVFYSVGFDLLRSSCMFYCKRSAIFYVRVGLNLLWIDGFGSLRLLPEMLWLTSTRRNQLKRKPEWSAKVSRLNEFQRLTQFILAWFPKIVSLWWRTTRLTRSHLIIASIAEESGTEFAPSTRRKCSPKVLFAKLVKWRKVWAGRRTSLQPNVCLIVSCQGLLKTA